mgnify:CR=1 FL=1
MAKTFRRGLSGLEDFSQGNAAFSRSTSTGGTQSLSSVPLFAGTGSPESVVTAPVGCIYFRRDGGAGTSIYVKESGTGSTGWIAYSTGAFANQAANIVFAGPTSGAAAAPAFRSLVSADIPNNAADTTGKSAKTDALNSATTVVNVASATAPTAGQILQATGSTAATWQSRTIAIPFVVDGGGAAITAGQKGHLEIPFACTITGWTILADQSGSIVVDVWKDIYANFPPTVADTIAGSEKPTLSAVQKNQDLTLTTWTTAIAAGDVLAFNVDSAATVTRVLVLLRATIP